MDDVPENDNAAYWTRRYAEQPDLGSGRGSRGFAARYKRRLVREMILQYRPRTVLDIGCGDMAFVDDDLFAGIAYVGLDISPLIVERNAGRFPQWRFLVGDITRASPSRADLVISFDVLIHQNTRATFDAALGNTLEAIGTAGLITYSSPPLADGTTPSFVPDTLDPDERAQERALDLLFANVKGRRDGMRTAHLGPLDASIAALRPDFRATVLGRYSRNIAYRVEPRRMDDDEP